MSSAYEREVLRLQRRYAEEVVEAFGFCPYAATARREGKSAEIVVRGASPADAHLLAEVEALGHDERIEVAFLILPDLALDRLALARRVEALRHAHQAGARGLVMTMEGFHPDAECDLGSAGRLVPFLRRTPFPTVQLTRLSALTRVRRSAPSGTAFVDPSSPALLALLSRPSPEPVSERIADDNLRTVRAVGMAAVERAIAAILRDRDDTLARLAGGE
jgi:hypothetical protein